MPDSLPAWLLWFLAMVLGAILALAGRRLLQRQSTTAGRFPPGYIQGVQDLFVDQPDQAVASFMRMLEADPGTVEPHFAMAGLFLRRGEVDRAIRIHQNLISRPSLADDVRRRALEALADDYLQAGLLDRAESVARSLLDANPGNQPALSVLLSVYEQEREWVQAIAVARRGRDLIQADVLAHYYCELAGQHCRAGDLTAARRALREAMTCVNRFYRAELMLADIDRQQEHWSAALKGYRRLLKNAPVLLSEMIDSMLACLAHVGRWQQELPGLRQSVLSQDAIQPVLSLANELRQREGDDQAAALLHEFLERVPSLRGMGYLIDLRAPEDGLPESDCLTIRTTLQRLAEATKTYRCRRCGFSGRQIHWQCPGCRSWGSIHAVQEHLPR